MPEIRLYVFSLGKCELETFIFLSSKVCNFDNEWEGQYCYKEDYEKQIECESHLLNGTQAKGATKMGSMIIFLILEIISLSLDYY